MAAGPRVTLDIKSLRVPPRAGTPALEASEPEESLRLLARSEYPKARSGSLPAKAKTQARERVVPPWRVVEEALRQERAVPSQRAPPRTAAREEEPHPPPSPSGPQPSEVSGVVVEHFRLTSTSLSPGRTCPYSRTSSGTLSDLRSPSPSSQTWTIWRGSATSSQRHLRVPTGSECRLLSGSGRLPTSAPRSGGTGLRRLHA